MWKKHVYQTRNTQFIIVVNITLDSVLHLSIYVDCILFDHIFDLALYQY